MRQQPGAYNTLATQSTTTKALFYEYAGNNYAAAATIYEINIANYNTAVSNAILAAQSYNNAGTNYNDASSKVFCHTNAGIYFTKAAVLYQNSTTPKSNNLSGDQYVASGNNYNLAAVAQTNNCAKKALYYTARDRFNSAGSRYLAALNLVNKTTALASATTAGLAGDLIVC